MTEFNYGDPHPLLIDRRERKRRTDERAALHYLNVLTRAGDLYRRDGAGETDARALFDLEAANVRRWQQWSADRFCAAPDDPTTRTLAARYPTVGSELYQVRLPPREWIRWSEVAVRAFRTMKNRSGEGAALGNLGNAWSALGDAPRAVEYHEHNTSLS